MRACFAAILLCMPGCAGFFADAHTVVRQVDELLVRVEFARNAVCGTGASCVLVDERVKALAAAPVEESVVTAGQVLELLKVSYQVTCVNAPAPLVEPCAVAKSSINSAVDVFNKINEQVPE